MKKYITTAMILLTASTQSAAATITVGAASSLRESLTEVAHSFESEFKEATVRLMFAGSATIARQIRAKAPIDVFIAADQGTMDHLQKSGLLQNSTRQTILGNTLVLATPNHKTGITSPKDLAKGDVKRIALCDEAVPVGHYSNVILRKAGLYQAVRAKSVKLTSVRSVLSMISKGGIDAGFVYATDIAMANGTVKEVWRSLDKTLISYPAAALASSKKSIGSAKFIQFLATTKAQKIFAKFGFRTMSSGRGSE